jgi:hypothetical protein
MFDGPRLFAFAGPSGTGVSEKLLLAVGNLPQRLKRLRKVVTNAQSLPQALKRGQILDDLAARVELVPFPRSLELDFSAAAKAAIHPYESRRSEGAPLQQKQDRGPSKHRLLPNQVYDAFQVVRLRK